MSFNIIIDTREQQPFYFEDYTTIVKTLNTGDYSIEGLEDKLTIERKGSVAEFYKNIAEKRFWAEMIRMQQYKYKFMIFEFSVSDVEMFPYGSGLSKTIIAKLKMSASYLMKCISTIQVGYDVHILFGGNRDNSVRLITNIMKATYEREH